MDIDKLQEIILEHEKWLNDSTRGKKADLRGADLSRANLIWADLRRANLSWADLSGADLRKADLSKANLSGVDLSGADLRRANLSWADLSEANLSGADLSRADIDFSVLPLWCGGQFKTDKKICKQLVAHVVRIMELSEIDKPELIKMMNEYKKGWHRESEL